jgi:hypothetical protein
MLSDRDLIKTFIQQSMQRQEPLLANPMLQANRMGGVNQLTAKREGVVMHINCVQDPPQFSVNQQSSYGALIGQVLLEQGFAPATDLHRAGAARQQPQFVAYQPFDLPPGYAPHCTKAVDLWRAWWRYSSRNRNQIMPLDIVIRQRHTWYPIKDIYVSQGPLYVTILGGDLTLQPEDVVLWLERTAEPAAVTPETIRARRGGRIATPA